MNIKKENAVSVDRTRDLQIFSLTLSQLSYPRKSNNAPAGNRTRVCTVAGYYSTTRPLVLRHGILAQGRGGPQSPTR